MMENLSLDLDAKKEGIRKNYFEIAERIEKAAQQSGRTSEDITFLAATKTVPAALINYAISLGLKAIGENKVQELLSKYDEYNLSACDLHLIGHLQTNKVKQIVGKVCMIQSVDSVKLAKEISKQSLALGVETDVLLEINIGSEENKTGAALELLPELLEQTAALPSVHVRGLMTIPPICDKKTDVLKFFDKMHNLFVDISSKKLDNVTMDYLSMGMSGDYEEAILSGANMVRIGSLLFGVRDYSKK